MTKLTPFYKVGIFWFQLIAHCAIVPMIMHATWQQWSIAVFFYFMFGCVGIAMTYHRFISHKSYEQPRWFTYLGLFFGGLAGLSSAVAWTAVHREHHRYSDTDKDPHAPLGQAWKMQFLVMLVPGHAKYAVDAIKNPLYMAQHKYYWHMHLLWIALLVAIDPFALVYAYLVPAVVLYHIMAALGTVTHSGRWGYRNFDRNDRTMNITWLGWFAFGEGWHNNHHSDAGNYRFGKTKYEVDLAARLINLIRTDKS
jgi:stearoyl-CoA desaturase (delta-9 desaturase)